MLEQARSMLNCARAAAMPAMSPAPPMSMASMSLMDAFYPMNWLKLAAGLLNRLEQISPLGLPTPLDAVPMASVLDTIPLPAAAPLKSLASAPNPLPPAAPNTGWGPMP